jgi:signal recognition particle subunit SRP54
MLETLTQGFRNARARLKGFRQLSEGNIEEALEQVKESLLEADVEYHVALSFLEQVKKKAVGELVQTKVTHKGQEIKATPADHFVKICHDQLVSLMGSEDTGYQRSKTRPVTTVMMVGLQGSGKTTTAAKLARNYLKDGRKPMLVAADVYRPAAIEQLMVLGERVGVPVFYDSAMKPPQMCKAGVIKAMRDKRDVVIFDTAGRLAIDDALMQELEQIDKEASADNIYLVVDAMIGQDAVKTAGEFNRRLKLDGVILTKLDGDARGGAALSVRAVTGKPIKYVGMGEGMDRLEPFRPEGLASRILGFGDVVGLMKDFEEVVDVQKAEEDAVKMLKGQFNLVQFLDQVKMLRKMGPLQEMVAKLPFFPDGLPDGFNVDEKALVRIESLIQSMTPKERAHPELLGPSRIKRIARGAGRHEREVEDLLTRFKGMKQMMSAIGKQPGLLGRIPGFQQMAQAQAVKGMKPQDMFPGMPPAGPGMPPGMPPGMHPGMHPGMAGMPGMEGQRRMQPKFAEVDKRRKKAKEARKQRKKAMKKKKGKK